MVDLALHWETQNPDCGMDLFVVLNPLVQELAANVSLHRAHLGLRLECSFRVASGNVNRNNNTVLPLFLLWNGSFSFNTTFVQWMCSQLAVPDFVSSFLAMYQLCWRTQLQRQSSGIKGCLCHAKNAFLRQVERRWWVGSKISIFGKPGSNSFTVKMLNKLNK